MARLATVMVLLVSGLTAVAENATAGASGLNARVKIETSLGTIVLELDGEKAPISSRNFIQYADDKFYDGTVFHRVMVDFMIQGGGFTAEMDKKTEGLRPPIKNEWQNGLSNVRGSIAMARTKAADSATSQFFINVVNNDSSSTRINLDAARGGAAYAVFGKVVEGMDIVDKIRNVAVAGHPKYQGGKAPTVPAEPVVVTAVRVVGDFDRAALDAKIKANEDAVAAEAAKLKAEFRKKLVEAREKGTKTESGLVIYDLKVGDGASPAGPTDRVTVHCTGWLTDGRKFYSTYDPAPGSGAVKPLVNSVSGFVKGFTEGVLTMKIGGKRTLVIPGDLGYGPQGNARAGISPNATLVFDVELLAIVAAP